MSLTIIIAVICAYIIKGMCGFGNTLIFSTMMSFTTKNINISPIDLIVGYPTNIYITIKERRAISVKSCIPPIIMVMLGSIVGVFFLRNGDAKLIKALFGFTIVFIGVESFVRERQKLKKTGTKLELLVIGVISGILCGLYGIGAFLAAYTSRTSENQKQFRGNTCFILLIENTFRFALYLVSGILNLVILKKAILLLPFMVIGFSVGLFLSKSSSEKLIRQVVVILLILSGISLIVNNIKW